MTDGMKVMLDTAEAQLRSCRQAIARLKEQESALLKVKAGIEDYLRSGGSAADAGAPTTARVTTLWAEEPRGKEAVMVVLAEQAGRPMTVPQIRDEVLQRGWIDPSPRVLEAIRTNLGRAMDKYPEIKRVRKGLYLYENADGPDSSGPSDTHDEDQGGGDNNAASVAPLRNWSLGT